METTKLNSLVCALEKDPFKGPLLGEFSLEDMN
jgi:hypothetical protein